MPLIKRRDVQHLQVYADVIRRAAMEKNRKSRSGIIVYYDDAMSRAGSNVQKRVAHS